MTQPATSPASLAAQLRNTPSAAAEVIAGMRDDAETRLTALEGAPAGGEALPQITTRALGAGDALVMVVCHCVAQRSFEGALVFLEGNVDAILANNTNYKVFEIYEHDEDGVQVGVARATGTTQLTGDNAFPNVEGAVPQLAPLRLTLDPDPIVIGAGNSAVIAITPVASGVALPAMTVVLLPA